MKIDISKFMDWSEDEVETAGQPDYVHTALDLVNMDVESIPMLFEGLIPKVGLWSVVGASDTGKSMLLRQIAMCVAGERGFLDKEINPVHGSAIVVSTEDDETALAFLLKKQNTSMQLSPDQLSRLRIICDTENLVDKLEGELIRQSADLIVIDAFGDVFDGKNASDSAQVRPFLNRYSQLAGKHQCSIGFLHHTGKRTEALTPSKNNTAGSQAFEAKMRLLLELRTDPVEDNKRHLCPVKGNYMGSGEKSASYELVMDENFVFTSTGNRISFGLLSAEAIKASGKKRTKPKEFTEAEHFDFLRSAIKNKESWSSLRGKIRSYFGLSDQTARNFITYYEAQEFIKDISMSERNKDYILTERVTAEQPSIFT